MFWEEDTLKDDITMPCTTEVEEKLSDDIVCVVVNALFTETLFRLLVVVLMAIDLEVLTIQLELGDVVVDRSVEFTLPLIAETGELGARKTDEVFSVLEAFDNAGIDGEDGRDPVIVEEEEANEQN